jgi:CRP-like cAMP-binding protein
VDLAQAWDSKKTDAVTSAFERDHIIYHQGDDAVCWYEVAEGVVRLSRILADGARQVIGFCFTGEVFGTESGTRLTTAEPITQTRLIVRRLDLGLQAGRGAYLVKANHKAQAYIRLLGHRTAQERVAAFLLNIASRPGGSEVIELPMSRTDIADHLGITIHTVSRTLSQFVRDGIIATQGRHAIHIRDMAALSHCGGEPQLQPKLQPRAPQSPFPSQPEVHPHV